MWTKSFLVFFFSLSTLKAEMDCNTMRKAIKLPPPRLSPATSSVRKGQKVSLTCLSHNRSLQITYSLFRNEKYMGNQERKGEPMIFNVTISEAQDLGPYKCKAQVSNCWQYSDTVKFTLVDPVSTPVLKIKEQTDGYVKLHCIASNGSLPINYTLFKKGVAVSPVISMPVREPAEFNVTGKNTAETGDYTCEAKNTLPDHARYSDPVAAPSAGGDSCPLCLQLLLPVLLLVLVVATLILAFWGLPKYKARKAMRPKAPSDYGNTPMEAPIYATVYQNQADAESVPGLEPRPRVSTAHDETHRDDKTGHVYSELNF